MQDARAHERSRWDIKGTYEDQCGGDYPEREVYKYDFNKHEYVPTHPGTGNSPQ